MIRCWLWVLLLIGSTSQSFGQFSLKFHLDESKNTNQAYRIHEHDNSYFVLVGTLIDSLDGYTIQSGMARLDKEGNILWKNQYIRDVPPYLTGFRSPPGGDLLFDADTLIYWGQGMNSDGTQLEQVLLKVSPDGSYNEFIVIHQDSATFLGGNQAWRTSNNEVIQFCIEKKNGNPVGKAFVKLGSNFEYKGSKSIMPNSEWRLNGVFGFILVNDSTYAVTVVGGKRIQPTNKDSFWNYVMLYDKDFNPIKQYQYLARDYWSYTDYVLSLNKRPGGYYLVGEPYEKFKAFPLYDTYPTVVLGLDADFKEVWADTMWYEIGTYVKHRFSFTCANGDLLSVFSYRKSPETKAYAMIMRRDAAGNVLWKRIVQERYGGFFDFTQTLSSGIEDADGNFVFVGYIYVFDPIERVDGWVLKLDADGCFHNGCTSEEVIIDQVTSVLNVWEESEAPLVFPNPIRDQGRIELPNMLNGHWELRIYDSSSRLIQSSNGRADGNSNDIPLDCSDLPNGVYYGQIKSDNQFIQSFKVVVIH